jgi:hypothetical protein
MSGILKVRRVTVVNTAVMPYDDGEGAAAIVHKLEHRSLWTLFRCEVSLPRVTQNSRYVQGLARSLYSQGFKHK